MRIYLTHCCAKKDDTLKDTGEKVPPDRLYAARPTRRFMDMCKRRGVQWAILSDKYGVWFPDVRHEWYEKHPNTVTEEEYRDLLMDFHQKLRNYDEICFYYNPGRFHSLYKRLLTQTTLRDGIALFSHYYEIA